MPCSFEQHVNPPLSCPVTGGPIQPNGSHAKNGRSTAIWLVCRFVHSSPLRHRTPVSLRASQRCVMLKFGRFRSGGGFGYATEAGADVKPIHELAKNAGTGGRRLSRHLRHTVRSGGRHPSRHFRHGKPSSNSASNPDVRVFPVALSDRMRLSPTRGTVHRLRLPRRAAEQIPVELNYREIIEYGHLVNIRCGVKT